MPGMSPRIKAKKGRYGTQAVVTITAPAALANLPVGVDFTATATAFDPETGDVSANLRWLTDDGDNDISVGTGASITVNISVVGTYLLTARLLNDAAIVSDAINIVIV